MKIKKPNFWDYKKPNFISYCLLPLTFPIIINNFLRSIIKNKNVNKNIRTICFGNIYIGGTGKTPLTIKISQILKNHNFNTVTIKKFYKDQIDEQRLLDKKTNFYCDPKRIDSLNKAINKKIDIAIFDDGLQDKSMNYDLSFVCFNSSSLIGNGFLIPAGPLREKINSICKYDAIFINGNNENIFEFKNLIKSYNPNIKIFESYYVPSNINNLEKNQKYLIFSGIGNPESFKNTLIKNDINVVKDLTFPDHYEYTKKDIESIKLEAKKLNAKILTTEKDFLKLKHDNMGEINFLEIEMIIKEENELIKYIKSKL